MLAPFGPRDGESTASRRHGAQLGDVDFTKGQRGRADSGKKMPCKAAMRLSCSLALSLAPCLAPSLQRERLEDAGLAIATQSQCFRQEAAQ